ncbi:penicillin-binding protein 2 [Paenibacillus alginolyticus]|uniref:Penicillin-binding protein 2 n=1 Tax=Paenibacillus alginolyticus TaxID=59839 RepID=A0ABT4GAT6_9BACL|nr:MULTISPECIES: penicillin-binding transpeptidase domain-containing protein [Paenibacillus]MCY9667866.1 penicillin-binding protein 2 [Paenibacillus alginolyticus]MCY9693305.1 penicillin-binding protein 2 [Paenibacillus alginolyticus]MEC0145079.1 penicillin-binding transpeptidase domain-containing protein [Paenibacillus alginolyticus]NRF93182.1 penicillin-binding protein 2 [Paenibacillus frigoriresistens]
MKSSIMDDPKKKEITKKRHFSFRINIFFFITFLLFSILIVRLAILQFVQAKDLKAAENTNTNQTTSIAPIRGNIYDSTKSPLAYTIPVQSLFFRIEPGQQNKDEVIALAQRLKVDVFDKYAKPNSVSPTPEEIVLAMDLGYDINKNKVKDPSYYWVPRRIKADLSKGEMAYLLEHRDEFKWLEVTEESIRTYEMDDDNKTTIATHLVGYLKSFSTQTAKDIYKDSPNSEEYLNSENVGFDGIERMYQDELRGKNGSRKYPVNAAMKIIGRAEVTAPVKGNNLYLSINKDIQKATERMLEDHIKYLRSPTHANDLYMKTGMKATSGFAVAMEVDTGRVVTMANYPDYDANAWTGGISPDIYKEIGTYISNGSIMTAKSKYPDEKENAKHPSSIVFMGSTIKPLSVLIGLKEKLFGAYENYYDSGSFSFGKGGSSTITNSGKAAYGYIDAAGAIEHSSNTFMSEKVGIPFYLKYGGESPKVTAKWAEYLAKFGMGVKTGSGLPGEFAGSNDFIKNAQKDSYQSAMVYASWGQNEKTTTLQLAQYTATLASRGKRMKPLFVDEIQDYQGKLVKKIEPEVIEDFSSEFAKEDWNVIIHGMKSGAEGIDELPFNVARKTGTSTQAVSGGSVENAVFIAFAPVENPKLAVAVVVPEGGFGRYGASPIAAKIFQAYDAANDGILTKLGGGKRPW